MAGSPAGLNLDSAVTVPAMMTAWKNAVRLGLRKQGLPDLHDYLDVHWGLKGILEPLRRDVLRGLYHPSPSETVTEEKANGIVRRLVLPAPRDAILLQAMSDALHSYVQKGQPSNRAFYSRSHLPAGPAAVDVSFDYSWWKLWPQYQGRILKFTTNFPFLVAADISNYFDCIPLRQLRNSLAALGSMSEDFLNFLFYMLEAFVWRPDYVPHSGTGLPQLDFDAPRLLAHAYLFPVDRKLDLLAGANFVRWMDDINGGAPDTQTAKELLGALAHELAKLGLRLNTSKTRILTAGEATAFFWLTENRMLTILENAIDLGAASPDILDRVTEILAARYRRFLRRKKSGNWSRVLKRYFTLCVKSRLGVMQDHVPRLLPRMPEVRASIFRYYLALGYSKARMKHIVDYLQSRDLVDSISLFSAARLIVQWKLPRGGAACAQAVALAHSVFSRHPEVRAGLASATWLLSKYGSQSDLSALVVRSTDTWCHSQWLGRQVAAVLYLLTDSAQQHTRQVIARYGLWEAQQVLASIQSLRDKATLGSGLRKYLLHRPTPPYPYPHYKAILAETLLTGSLHDRTELLGELLSLTDDPIYRHRWTTAAAR